MDLIREMLLWFEEHPDRFVISNEFKIFRDDAELTLAYLAMLQSGRVVEEASKNCWRMTWESYEFVDKVRDPEIWNKTKEGASKLNSWSVKLIGEMASGFIRAKAAELGIPLV